MKTITEREWSDIRREMVEPISTNTYVDDGYKIRILNDPYGKTFLADACGVLDENKGKRYHFVVSNA